MRSRREIDVRVGEKKDAAVASTQEDVS